MLLHNVNIVGAGGPKHIYIANGKFKAIVDDERYLSVRADGPVFRFQDALAMPGLINSHDHLDFNLFPRLGNRIYDSYVEWGADIQQQDKEEIKRILNIPGPLRIQWGLYKNLLTGVTTVVNHGKKLTIDHNLIDVFQRCQSIHSVDRGKYWKFQINQFYKKHLPVAIHIGEGTNDLARREIDQLIKWNYFGRQLVGIHGVAMNKKQAAAFRGLVWCPASNYFLLDTTAAIDTLKQATSILFGTDSTLTASWNIWDHLRMARDKKLLSDQELFDTLTKTPARVWNLPGRGDIKENAQADLVVAERKEIAGQWESFYGINPENLLLIIHRGDIRLFDNALYRLVEKFIPTSHFSKVYINGVGKYVQGDLPALVRETRKYNPIIKFPVSCD